MTKTLLRAFLLLLSCSAAAPAFAQKGMDKIKINGQFLMAARTGNVDRVVALLDQGAAVNSRDRNGDSPLMGAAFSGNGPSCIQTRCRL